MFETYVNIWAVITATIITTIIGMFWYSSTLFGKMWMEAVGKSMEELKKANKAKTYILNILVTLLMAYVLATIVGYFGATTVAAGIQIAFWLWLGLVIPTSAGMYLWESRPVKLYVINNGYHLVSLLVMGAILSVWLQ